MMKVFFRLLLITFLMQGCVQSKAKEIQVVTADELNTHIRYNTVEEVEIQSKEDFKKSHLISADNIIGNEELREDLKKLDKNSPIAIYITTNNRSNEAALILKEIGFQQIYILDNGIKKWNLRD
ncbi:rhodanese-related sulfurtransferase [Gillisia mitskevichiae]|uniref:Rhodanese-related sulfurtransferase n=1 Tax=Gillisia mitskevichiae TaxID=270921 RepID=A0A495NZP8_9FLAO|nr:rhodanese-like domain-containing protein [Gillisia mitskevichiae]RKS43357.1 rhodanese-related sulfurtransferase [Gillisia mitskevichiae]